MDALTLSWAFMGGFFGAVAFIITTIMYEAWMKPSVQRWRKQQAQRNELHRELLQHDKDYAFECGVRGERVVRKAYTVQAMSHRMERVYMAMRMIPPQAQPPGYGSGGGGSAGHVFTVPAGAGRINIAAIGGGHGTP